MEPAALTPPTKRPRSDGLAPLGETPDLLGNALVPLSAAQRVKCALVSRDWRRAAYDDRCWERLARRDFPAKVASLTKPPCSLVGVGSRVPWRRAYAWCARKSGLFDAYGETCDALVSDGSDGFSRFYLSLTLTLDGRVIWSSTEPLADASKAVDMDELFAGPDHPSWHSLQAIRVPPGSERRVNAALRTYTATKFPTWEVTTETGISFPVLHAHVLEPATMWSVDLTHRDGERTGPGSRPPGPFEPLPFRGYGRDVVHEYKYHLSPGGAAVGPSPLDLETRIVLELRERADAPEGPATSCDCWVRSADTTAPHAHAGNLVALFALCAGGAIGAFM
jgi:hypothetical protein